MASTEIGQGKNKFRKLEGTKESIATNSPGVLSEDRSRKTVTKSLTKNEGPDNTAEGPDNTKAKKPAHHLSSYQNSGVEEKPSNDSGDGATGIIKTFPPSKSPHPDVGPIGSAFWADVCTEEEVDEINALPFPRGVYW